MKRIKTKKVWRLLFLLATLMPLTLAANSFRETRKEGISVKGSRDFYRVLQNKSTKLLYLDGEVEVRNYYGWTFPQSPSEPRGTVNVSAFPVLYPFEQRPTVDIDGHSLYQLMSGRETYVSNGVHYLNVKITPAVERGVREYGTVILEDCIVEVFVLEKLKKIRTGWKYLRSLMENPSDLPEEAGEIVTGWWCDRNSNIQCPYGGVVYPNVTIPWTSTFRWHLKNVVIKFVPRTEKQIATPKMFGKAMEISDGLEIPFGVNLNYLACGTRYTPNKVSIYDPKRRIPPTVPVDFGSRLYGCVEVLGSQVIRVSDLILLNLFESVGWPVLFPFINAKKGATVILENVVIEMQAPPNFSNASLPKMAKSISERDRPIGTNNRPQKIDIWGAVDCDAYIREWSTCQGVKCPDHDDSRCPHGAIFVEDVSYTTRTGDGNADLGIGVLYHIRHALVKLVPPPGGFFVSADVSQIVLERDGERKEVSDARTSGSVKEKAVSSNGSSRHTLIAIIIIAVSIGAVTTICAYTLYKLKALKKQPEKPTGEQASDSAEKSGSETETRLIAEAPSERFGMKTGECELTHVRPSATKQMYQQAATNMLGSVTLGQLLGAGSFGKVFKATWSGAIVAVKVIVHDEISYRSSAAHREASLSSHLHHPNIVQTFDKSTREIKQEEYIPTMPHQPYPITEAQRRPSPLSEPPMEQLNNDGYVTLAAIVPDESIGSASEISSSRGRSFSIDRFETWIVQEFCNMGSLEKAIRRGKYMPNNQVNIILVVDTCIDICRGMVYLKNRSIIHGDLKSSNILLHGSLHEEKEFVAKVADFGLSRELLGHASHVQTATTGTVTHMPPELFKEQRLTAASDVYAFGIVMWELVSKESPLEGFSPVAIITKVVCEKWRPEFADGIPEPYVNLACRCWAEDPLQRPPIDLVLTELMHMKQHFGEFIPRQSP